VVRESEKNSLRNVLSANIIICNEISIIIIYVRVVFTKNAAELRSMVELPNMHLRDFVVDVSKLAQRIQQGNIFANE